MRKFSIRPFLSHQRTIRYSSRSWTVSDSALCKYQRCTTQSKTVSVFEQQSRSHMFCSPDAFNWWGNTRKYATVANQEPTKRKKSVEELNQQLQGFFEEQNFDKMLKLFLVMKEHNIMNEQTFEILFKSFLGEQDVERLEYYENEFKQSSVPHTNEIYNLIIYAYGRLDRMDKVNEYIHEMKSKRMTNDQITFNLLIDIYGIRKDFKKMEDTLTDMINSRSARPDIITWNTILASYGLNGEKVGFQNTLARIRNTKMKMDIETFRVMLGYYMRVNDVEGITDTYRTMIRQKIIPDIAMFSDMSAFFAEIEHPARMDDIIQEMIKYKTHSETAWCNIILTHWRYNLRVLANTAPVSDDIGLKQVHEYFRLLDKTEHFKDKPHVLLIVIADVTSRDELSKFYNMVYIKIANCVNLFNDLVIQAILPALQGAEVFECYEHMKALLLTPNIENYHWLLHNVFETKEFNLMETLIADMKHYKISKDIIVYKYLLQYYNMEEKPKKVLAVYKRMEQRNIPLDLDCYNMLLLSLSEMYQDGGKVTQDELMRTLRTMRQESITPNFTTFAILFNMIPSNSPHFDEVERYFAKYKSECDEYLGTLHDNDLSLDKALNEAMSASHGDQVRLSKSRRSDFEISDSE